MVVSGFWILAYKILKKNLKNQDALSNDESQKKNSNLFKYEDGHRNKGILKKEDYLKWKEP